MAIVLGQIAPLKMLKEALNKNGITRFNSIGEINSFIKNYESEKKEKFVNIEISLDEEIKNLNSEFLKRKQIYEDLNVQILNELNEKIKALDEALKQAIEKRNKNIIHKIICYFKIRKLEYEKLTIRKNLVNTVKIETSGAEFELTNARNKLNEYTENRTSILSSRCAEFSEYLSFTKEVVDGLYPLIAGAIGENSVVNELQKLPDDYYLINDFSVRFSPPIYNKKENDKIHSIQIDHLLICQSGVFLLETKNWSDQSIMSLDLRSPVKQIFRTNYALFMVLNGESKFNHVGLTLHHWGSKKIPIRNIIVMTNKKPKEEFKHVKVLSLNELNGYINYFEKIFSQAEVKNIFNYLNHENKNAS